MLALSAYHLDIEPLGKGNFLTTLNGETIVPSTSEPLLAGARALLERGASPDAPITIRHKGARHISMSSTIGYAATFTVVERKAGGIRFAKWKEFSLV